VLLFDGATFSECMGTLLKQGRYRPLNLYENEVEREPRKFKTTWLGPYINEDIRASGALQLKSLQGNLSKKVLIGAKFNRYSAWSIKAKN